MTIKDAQFLSVLEAERNLTIRKIKAINDMIEVFSTNLNSNFGNSKDWKSKVLKGLLLCKNSTGTIHDICNAILAYDHKSIASVYNALNYHKQKGNIIRLSKKHEGKYVYAFPKSKELN